jgi:hypothetical protein
MLEELDQAAAVAGEMMQSGVLMLKHHNREHPSQTVVRCFGMTELPERKYL